MSPVWPKTERAHILNTHPLVVHEIMIMIVIIIIIIVVTKIGRRAGDASHPGSFAAGRP